MQKAQIVSPILDMQIKQRSYKKHMDALVAIKPVIDTSKPPPVPRLDAYKKRMTRERMIQLQIENDNIKMLKNLGKQRNKSRKAFKTAESLSDEDFIEDWEDQLNLVDVELGSKSSNERPAPLLSDPSKSHYTKNVINDDGMEVVDENVVPKPVVVKPFDSTKKKTNSSRSGLRRLNPLKKPLNSNKRRHQQQEEEEDYNDNDVDDENYGNDSANTKSDNFDDDRKYSSDSSRSLSEDETNMSTNPNICSRRKNDIDDDDSYDKYEKASENTDRNGDKSGQLFSGNLDDFEPSRSDKSDFQSQSSGNLSDSYGKSGKLTKLSEHSQSNTESMHQNKHSSDSSDIETSTKPEKESESKNGDGFDNFDHFENDDEDNTQKEKSDKEDNSQNDLEDDFNMDSIPEL